QVLYSTTAGLNALLLTSDMTLGGFGGSRPASAKVIEMLRPISKMSGPVSVGTAAVSFCSISRSWLESVSSWKPGCVFAYSAAAFLKNGSFSGYPVHKERVTGAATLMRGRARGAAAAASPAAPICLRKVRRVSFGVLMGASLVGVDAALR